MAHKEWCLRPGEELKNNEYLRSKNGLFYAVMQEDANFVVYRGDWWEAPQDAAGLAMWSLFTAVQGYQIFPGSFIAIMQTNGDFCVYHAKGGENVLLWNSRTYEKTNDYWLILQDDGNLCIKRKGDVKESPKWCTGKTDSVEEKNIELAEMVYDFNNAKITPNGGPKSASSVIAINTTPKPQTATLSIAYSETTSTGWKTSTTLKVGGKTSVKCGVPGLAEGKVEVSYEQSTGFEWNKTTTKSETRTYSLPVTVDPGTGVLGRMTWSESTIAVPYRMKGKATFASGKKAPISVTGTFEGISSHDAIARWVPYKEGEKEAAAAMLSAAPTTVLP
jgi:hypothetical protein